MTKAFAIQMPWLETAKTCVIPMSTAHLRVTRIADGCIALHRFVFSLSLSLSLLGAIVEMFRGGSKAAIHVSSQASGEPGFTLDGR